MWSMVGHVENDWSCGAVRVIGTGRAGYMQLEYTAVLHSVIQH